MKDDVNKAIIMTPPMLAIPDTTRPECVVGRTSPHPTEVLEENILHIAFQR